MRRFGPPQDRRRPPQGAQLSAPTVALGSAHCLAKNLLGSGVAQFLDLRHIGGCPLLRTWQRLQGAESGNRPKVCFRRDSVSPRKVGLRNERHSSRDVHRYRGSLQLFSSANSGSTRLLAPNFAARAARVFAEMATAFIEVAIDCALSFGDAPVVAVVDDCAPFDRSAGPCQDASVA